MGHLNSQRPAAEVAISDDLVRTLLAEQCPDLAGEKLSRVGEGWDNVTYRIGPRWAARLPRRQKAAHLLLKEQRWLGELAGHLAIELPIPDRIGHPSPLFPWSWSVVPWIEGSTADVEPLGAGQGERLAGILLGLHRSAPADAPKNPFRGVPLRDRAQVVGERLEALSRFDTDVVAALRRFWTLGMAAPDAEERVWVHGDLHPMNALVRGGELVGLIDWGDLAGGDRATDLAAAWTLLRSSRARRNFWDRYGWAEATWMRSRAWAVLFGTLLATSGEGDHEEARGVILHELMGSEGEAARWAQASSQGGAVG